MKHSILIAGTLSVFISLLFFGLLQDVYGILLLVGSLSALFSYLVILFGSGSLREKLIWTLFLIVSVLIIWIAEPMLIGASFRFYIVKNRDKLEAVNKILTKKKGEVFIFKDGARAETDSLNHAEQTALEEARKELRLLHIFSNDKKVYFEISGFLDNRIGITYWKEEPSPQYKLRHLIGNWYY